MAKHDLGIIGSFEENKWYSVYEPEKYNLEILFKWQIIIIIAGASIAN